MRILIRSDVYLLADECGDPVYLGEHRQTLFSVPPDPRRWMWRVAVAVNLRHVYRDYRGRMAGLLARLPRAKDQTKTIKRAA